MNSCIDFDAKFGRRFQVSYEESYYEERGESGRLKDPWLRIIPCRFGHHFPHGGSYLGASTTHRGPVASRLAALPCVRVVQDGDDGINVVFHVKYFDAVAAMMKPRRRRRLTTDQRADRVEGLRSYQFTPAAHDAGDERRRDPSQPAGDRSQAANAKAFGGAAERD